MRSLLIVFLSLLALPAIAEPISVRADIWCPYNCAAADKKTGYGIEVLKTIFESAGHTVDYQNLNWAESIERTRKNEFVAIIGAAKNDAPDFVFPAEPIGLSSISYATMKDKNISISSVADLQDMKLGVIEAYSYNTSIDNYIAKHSANLKRISFSSGDDALDKNIQDLLAYKLDVICEDTNVLYYRVNKAGIAKKLQISRDPDKLSEIFVAFSPTNPKAKEYAALIDKRIADLRSSGKLKSILQKYGLSDWK
ncbi:MAG: transporter substrate-binding domain-containing protein [Alphaproteobacteria bacterium]|nr:transporter substrate-binding domain-containing protein [Alphaproteobacteria bacterium]